MIGDKKESQLYFLADNIYPRYPIFMQSFGTSTDVREEYFSKRLGSVRKDVERAFGILQGRFACLTKPSLYWQLSDLYNEVMCCIILHNMILDDEHSHQEESTCSEFTPSDNNAAGEKKNEVGIELQVLLDRLRDSQSFNKFITLRENLIMNMYSTKGSNIE